MKDRLRIHAEIWNDTAVSNPIELEQQLDDFYDGAMPWIMFRRGWITAISMAANFAVYYRRPLAVDAEHIFAHAMAAVGVYRRMHGRLPPTLDAAYAAAGIQPGFPTSFWPCQPEYQMLSQASAADPDTYAFRLSFRGDGTRIPMDGGVAWLVVRNPVFEGQDSLSIWTWSVLVADSRYGIPSEEGFPFFEELLSSCETETSKAYKSLGRLGWFPIR